MTATTCAAYIATMVAVRFVASVLALAGMACRATPPDGIFACTKSSECPLAQRCYDGLCRAAPPSPATETMADPTTRDAAPATAESPPPPSSESPPAHPSAGSEAGQSGGGAGSSGNAGVAAAGRAGDSAAGTSCVCSTEDNCCDGCRAKNENGSCGDAQTCAKQICRAGTCALEVTPGFCVVKGICFRDQQGTSGASCEYCDVKRSTSGLSLRAPGSACDDQLWCTGSDSCNEQGACVHHTGNTCTTGPCPRCDEGDNACIQESWTDAASGLEWLTRPLGPSVPFTQAKQVCDQVSRCGHDDWRLPTLGELRTLIRNCPATQTGGSCRASDDCLMVSCGDACSPCGTSAQNPRPYWPAELGTIPMTYWSASAVADADAAWFIDFKTAGIGRTILSEIYAVRCVRNAR